MSVGKPEDRKRIAGNSLTKSAMDGGLLLSTGWGLPAAAKKENFEAMLRTEKTYELLKK
jgi:hypothetical protein